MSERDIQVRIGFGDYFVLINEEGVAHSTEVLDDLVSRALTLFREGWSAIPELADDDADEAADGE